MGRHAIAELSERIARLQNSHKIGQIVEHPRDTELAGKPPAHLVVRRRVGERLADPYDREVLKVRGEPRALRREVQGQRVADVVREGFRFSRNEIAAKPGPDRLERSARDAALLLFRRRLIDQERLDRGEEQPLRTADTKGMLAGVAHGAAHLPQHEIAARNLLATQQRAFELCDQQSASRRRKLPEIFPQTLDG